MLSQNENVAEFKMNNNLEAENLQFEKIHKAGQKE